MKEILIALDYSGNTQKIAEMGFSIAKSLNGHITLLHVIADPAFYYSTEYSPVMGFSGFSATSFENNIEALRQAAKEFLFRARQYLQDNTIDIIIKEGDAADMILEAAKETDASLIIMASHGRKGLEKVLVGSVTESVLHNTTIPLFIIPTKE